LVLPEFFYKNLNPPNKLWRWLYSLEWCQNFES